MRCKLLQKRSTGKTTECSKRLQHITIERDIFSELSRCIFEISLKLVILKILFILVLYNFIFYFKIIWPPNKFNSPDNIIPPNQNKNFWPPPPAKIFLKFLPLLTQAGQGKGEGVHAMLCQKFWYWCAEKYFLLFIRFHMKLFPVVVVSFLCKNLIFFSPHLVHNNRKHFCSIWNRVMQYL